MQAVIVPTKKLSVYKKLNKSIGFTKTLIVQKSKYIFGRTLDMICDICDLTWVTQNKSWQVDGPYTI